MKSLIFIASIAIVSCSSVQNNQQKAEQAVKNYIIASNPKANLKYFHFTGLDTNGNVIGIIENKIIYDNQHRPILLRTVYYMLNKDLTKVQSVYTN